MSYTVPTGVPAALSAGATWKFKVSEDPQFPVSDSWVYTFYLVGQAGLNTVGVGASGEYTFTIAASSTDDVTKGPYRWQIRASLGGEIYPVSSGRLEVLEDSATAAGVDSRTWTEKMVSVIESLLYGSGTFPEVESYQVHGRQLVKMPREELFKLLQQLRGELSAVAGGGKRPSLRVYFGNAR